MHHPSCEVLLIQPYSLLTRPLYYVDITACSLQETLPLSMHHPSCEVLLIHYTTLKTHDYTIVPFFVVQPPGLIFPIQRPLNYALRQCTSIFQPFAYITAHRNISSVEKVLNHPVGQCMGVYQLSICIPAFPTV